MRLIACVVTFLLCGIAHAQTKTYSSSEAQNKSRAQIPVAGASTNIAITNVSATIGSARTANAVYMITCGTDTHLRWANTSTCTAVSTDFLITAGTILYYAVGPALEASYVCGIRDAVNGTCYVLEVR